MIATAKLRRALLVGAVTLPIGLSVWYLTRTEPLSVAVGAVARGRVEATVANTRAGTVEACQRARMSPPSAGQISTLAVHEGDHVSQGQVLLELWNEDRRASVKLAEAEVTAAHSRVDEACAMAEVAEHKARRAVELGQGGIASEEATEVAVGTAKANRAACDAAKASAEVSAARLELRRAELERTRLRAPFDGVIAKINGELGEFVTPSPVGVPTPPTVDLIENGCLYVSAPIDEVDAAAIRTGMPVRITLDAFAERIFAGSVRRIAPYVLDVEKQARTVEIEVDFVDVEETRGLLVGYSADVEVVLAERNEVLRVPTEAVLNGQHLLLYKGSGRRLEQRDIETGLTNWRHTEVLSGVDEGDRVVLSIDRAGARAGAPAVAEESERDDGRGA